MLAKDVMSSHVVTVEEKASLLDAVKLLINAGVSALPVLDDKGTLAGILSEYDVIRHVMNGEHAADLQSHLEDRGALADVYAQELAAPVADLMKSPAVSASEDTPLQTVTDLMVKHQIKRVVIVRDGLVVGVVSRADLVKALLSRPHKPGLSGAASGPQPAADAHDKQLRRDVTTAIRRLGLPLGGGFDVVVRHGTVHLWGQAVDEDHHRAYQAAAAEVLGVGDVYSHMHVVPDLDPAAWRP